MQICEQQPSAHHYGACLENIISNLFCAVSGRNSWEDDTVVFFFLPLYTTTDVKIVKAGHMCSLPGIQLTTQARDMTQLFTCMYLCIHFSVHNVIH